MRTKVSDFKLAELLIKKICKRKNHDFMDLYVGFEEDAPATDCLDIGSTKNIGQTIYKIVQAYINKFEDSDPFFDDETQKQDFLISTAAYLRGMVYSDVTEYDDEGFNALRLYQKPLVWIILKDIICPVFNRNIKNYQIIAGNSPRIDVSVFREEKSLNGTDPEKPFIFLNMDISDIPIRNVFLLLSAIEGLNLSPHKVIKDILESEISEKLEGIIKLAFDDDKDIDSFMVTLVGVLGYSQDYMAGKLAVTGDSQIKNAQYSTPTSWWYFGIIEKLLEPARGADWSTYVSLEPYVKEFWDKVEKYKEKKLNQADGVPFDVLLRIKSEDYKTDCSKTLESLLGSERVW